MKRTILYLNGSVAEYAFVPESELILSKSAHVAQIWLQNGHEAQIYMPKNGMPILLVTSAKDAMSCFELPQYDELEKLCEEQSYAKYGQSFLIGDALLRDGVCNLKKIDGIIKKIKKNLKEKNALVMIDESIRTGFDN